MREAQIAHRYNTWMRGVDVPLKCAAELISFGVTAPFCDDVPTTDIFAPTPRPGNPMERLSVPGIDIPRALRSKLPLQRA